MALCPGAAQQEIPQGRVPLQPEIIGAFAGTNVQQAFSGKSFSPALNTRAPVTAVAFSPDGKTLLSGSRDRTLCLCDVTGFQALRTLATHPASAAKVSEALQFLWERPLSNITFVHQRRRPSLAPIEGYHLADAAKYRELLNPPAKGETKLDQVLRWARKALGESAGESGERKLRQ